MATITGNEIFGYYGGSNNYQAYWQGSLTYTTSETATSVTISGNINTYFHRANKSKAVMMDVYAQLITNISLGVTAHHKFTFAAGEERWGASISSTFSTTITKTTSARTVNLKAEFYLSDHSGFNQGAQPLGDYYLPNSSGVNITIPALASYTVSYAANGGSSTPASQTKYYNQNITLRGAISRTGYSFARWKASNGTVYSAGGTYSANAATTMTAQWNPNPYTVSYNANGGSGAPGNQTKYHGIDLTLSSTKPVKSGYTFKGWATSTSNAGAGTVSYNPGGTYSSNAAITLYAVWELNYSKPTITSLNAERCLSDGTADDEGTYAKVTFSWSIFRSSAARYYGGSNAPYSQNAVNSCTITIGTVSASATLTGTSGNASVVVGSGTFSNDTQYNVSVAISDTQAIVSDKTTTVYGILSPTFFPMDFNADASACGFFMPAPDNKEGAFFGKDVFLPFNPTAASGTTDATLKTALNALGWYSDVIV